MGSGRKRRNVFQDESQQTERRRSSRILALEEKRESEKEKELRKNESANDHDNTDKGKGKEITLLCDHFISDYEQNSPTNNKGKCEAVGQLIPSTQPVQEGQLHENGSSSKTTNAGSSLNVMPQNGVLEFVLDVLQRNDPEELFAEPVNPNVVGDYYRIVKQPMDFGTMRAKLHEGMYTSLEQFKRDVYLMCINAMNINPANSRRYLVAESILGLAKKVIEDISGVDPKHFVLQSSTNKNPPAVSGGKPQGELPKTTGHARFRLNPAGRNIDTHGKALEIEKREEYWPPNDKSLCSEVLNALKPNLQLNKNAGNYRESLLRYTEGLGPTAQAVAAKKLEELKFKRLLNFSNLGNVADTTQATEAKAEKEAAKSLEAVNVFKQNLNYESQRLNLLGNVSEAQMSPQVEARALTASTQAPNHLLHNINGSTYSKVKVWPTQVISPEERKPYIPPMFERLIWPQTKNPSMYSTIPILQSRMRNNLSSLSSSSSSASASGISVSPSQVANFSRWANPNTCLYQGGDMQNLLRPTTHFNPSHMAPVFPQREPSSSSLLFPQQGPRSSSLLFPQQEQGPRSSSLSFPQQEPRRSSLLFPQQEAKSSSIFPQQEARPSPSALQLMPLGSELPKWEERQQHQPQHKQQQLLQEDEDEDEDDKELNLALQL